MAKEKDQLLERIATDIICAYQKTDVLMTSVIQLAMMGEFVKIIEPLKLTSEEKASLMYFFIQEVNR